MTCRGHTGILFARETAPDALESLPTVTPAPTTTEIRAQLAANRAELEERIVSAARSAGRDPGSITRIAVTKSVAPEVAIQLFELGMQDLAENRLASFDAKLEAFGERTPHWHYIGHIQRNKARRVVERSHTLHSLDSQRLLEHVARLAGELGCRPAVYLQVKLADEDNKSGFAPDEVEAGIAVALASPHVQLAGLMTMAPLCPGALEPERRARAAETFGALRDLASRWPELGLGLSMGMSGDFEEAIAEGSTALRIGSAYFRGLEPTRSHD